MKKQSKSDLRPYHAPQRQAAATRTREAIVRAGRHLFEQRGWAGPTVAAIADRAGVSQKSVEAIFGTKAALLKATVDYAIRGDTEPLPMTQRESVKEMEAAPDAATMLRLHAAHLRAINPRSARIAWTVEHAAASDPEVAKLWQRIDTTAAPSPSATPPNSCSANPAASRSSSEIESKRHSGLPSTGGHTER